MNLSLSSQVLEFFKQIADDPELDARNPMLPLLGRQPVENRHNVPRQLLALAPFASDPGSELIHQCGFQEPEVIERVLSAAERLLIDDERNEKLALSAYLDLVCLIRKFRPPSRNEERASVMNACAAISTAQRGRLLGRPTSCSA